MITALSITLVPAVLTLAVAYPLRPQCGRQRPHPVPARVIIDRLAAEARQGVIPADTFGGSGRPPAFTVQTRRLWRAA